MRLRSKQHSRHLGIAVVDGEMLTKACLTSRFCVLHPHVTDSSVCSKHSSARPLATLLRNSLAEGIFLHQGNPELSAVPLLLWLNKSKRKGRFFTTRQLGGLGARS